MKTYQDILTELSDNLFVANNYYTPKNTASPKVEILPGAAGSPERIETYRKMIEREEDLPTMY